MACIAAALVSCASPPPPPPPVAAAPVLYEWHGEDLEGPVRLEVDLAEQKLQIYRGDVLAGWSYVASGRPRYPTPTGHFRISEKVVDKISTNYGVIVDSNGDVTDSDARIGRESIPEGSRFVGAPMPYWMRLTGYGIGLHAGHIPNPGQPASHGCIRLPHDLAELLHEVADEGTPVIIRGRTPGA